MLKLHSFFPQAKKVPGGPSTSSQCISEIGETHCLSQLTSLARISDWLGYTNSVLIGQLQHGLPPLG